MKLHSNHMHRVVLALIGTLSMAAAGAAPAHAGGKSQSRARHFPPSTGLVRVVQDATWQFQNLRTAEGSGYALAGGCVSGETGVMGVHYANFNSVIDGQLDPTRPEILVYEPLRNGGMRLVAAEYIVFADDWDKTHVNNEPPVLMGQQMTYLSAPNRYRLPASYILHVWAWKRNPNGMYANFNPRVSCEDYAP